jgi:hypothetical protein
MTSAEQILQHFLNDFRGIFQRFKFLKISIDILLTIKQLRFKLA